MHATIHVYECPPMDEGWQMMPGVIEFAELAVNRDHHTCPSCLAWSGAVDLVRFFRFYVEAKGAALKIGWEGDMREGPRVFCVPYESSAFYGFIWKQDNNGLTYVVSEVELPHLANWKRG